MVLGSCRLIGKHATNTTTAASSTAASKSTIIFEVGGARYIAINAFAVRKASCFILCLPGTGTNLHPLVRAQRGYSFGAFTGDCCLQPEGRTAKQGLAQGLYRWIGQV